MYSSDSAFDTTGHTQLAIGDNSCIHSFDTSTVADVCANKTTNTGDSSSVFAGIGAGPLMVLGPAAPIDGGSFAVGPCQVPLIYRHPEHQLT